jgi:hypothetical protein
MMSFDRNLGKNTDALGFYDAKKCAGDREYLGEKAACGDPGLDQAATVSVRGSSQVVGRATPTT